MSLTFILNLICLIVYTSAFQSASECSQLYNYLTHTCQSCPTNTQVTADNTYCNCTPPFYPNVDVIGFMVNNSCIDLGTPMAQTTSIIVLYDADGTFNPQQVTCVDSYPNENKTACIPCGVDKTYSESLGRCVCKDSGYYIVGQSCFQSGQASSGSFASDSLQATLYEKSSVGCRDQNDQTSCQILLNNCAGSNYENGVFFSLLTQIDATMIPTYEFSSTLLNESLGIYASSKPDTNTTTVKNKLDFILFQYDTYGNLMDIKPLTQQILPCIATEQDLIYFQSFGLNLAKTCNVEDMNTPNQYSYDLFVKDVDGNLFPVPIRYPSQNQKLFRRFTLLSTAFKANMTYQTRPPLTVPYLNYTTQDTPQVVTQSRSQTFNITLVAPFIIMNVFILIVFIINFYKYVKYNPDETNDPYYFFKQILMFFLFAIKHWGIGLWIWLFGLSAYVFCFFKLEETVFLMLPHVQSYFLQYYDPFLAVFYVQYSFVLVSILLLIYDISSSTDYFMIDWEKEKDLSNFNIKTGHQKKQVSVWRKVLVVNELYELTVSNLINAEFVALFGLLFLKGLNWINLSYQIPNTQGLDTLNTDAIINPVLSYFIITFVFFIIGVLQYIFRHIVRIWDPLPYENFVDLCSISNISLVIFDEALHGYYIHGVNPLGQAEGSLQYIDSIFEKQARSFGKSRAFQSEDPDKIQIFQVHFPFTIRQAFQMKYKNQMIQKLVGRNYNSSVFSKPLPQFMGEEDYKEIEVIQNDMLESFKHYLQGVKTSQFNIKERGFISKLFSCPENFEQIGRLPVFFKDFWHEFTNVLMSGHEFLQLINLINFINIFFIATQNIFMGVFIAIMITRLIRLFNDFMIKRNISRNTLIDDKFFN